MRGGQRCSSTGDGEEGNGGADDCSPTEHAISFRSGRRDRLTHA
jgi:hypothetical protein